MSYAKESSLKESVQAVQMGAFFTNYQVRTNDAAKCEKALAG